MNIVRLNTVADDKIIATRVGGGSGGGGSQPSARKDVNFFDYDGTLLYSYSWGKAKNLTELPPLPVHDGLEVREWNYTLEDIKMQGEDYIIVDGQPCVYDKNVIIDGVEYKKYALIFADEGWSIVHKASDAVEEGTISYWCYNDSEIDGDSQGNPYEYPIQAVINAIGKVDIGACVYRNGEQITSYGVCIVPRGVEELNYTVQGGLFNVVSFPNTVHTMNSSTIYNSVILHELRIPCSVNTIKDYDPAFYQTSIAEGMWLNGYCKYINCCGEVEIFAPFAIPETVVELGELWEVSPYIIFPKSVLSIGYIGYRNAIGIRILDFSAATVIPDLLDYHNDSAKLHRVIVPDELYDNWVNATNWSAFAETIIKVSDIPWFNK